MSNPLRRIAVGVTGASGVIYAKRFLEIASDLEVQQLLIASSNAIDLFKYEFGEPLHGSPTDPRSWLDLSPEQRDAIQLLEIDNLAAGPASGSYQLDGMVVIPCSMKTLSAVAHGYADNLITRAADVQLKERRPLVIVPREAPLSAIHLKNMLTLARAGATILPAAPPFYHHPKNIADLADAIVFRALAQLNLPHPGAFHYE